ncbi:MAG: riboflavin biosynthesis protein RibF [Dysgonamonadaceae bacterium]|jgi:riboflavin kinase/FMN adenylyltransferase|nr:riboflavin biosynthesis protein RibF [Dysgonamonadaceae bacterium]
MHNEIAATIGFFDGVHLGHRFLIRQLTELAAAEGLQSAVITFRQHPRFVLQAEYQPGLLCTPDEKTKLLSALELDYCYLIDFSKELSQLSARTFIADILHKKLGVKQLLIGYDHRFGKDRAERFPDYARYGKEYGLNVVQAVELQDCTVSSTVIRNKLAEGHVEEANRLLSYNYSIEGKVIEGNQLGRTIGFPTANIKISDKNKIIPKEGIYAAWVHIGRKKHRGMAYIGRRPTVLQHGEPRIEVHILDFSADLYGKTLRIEFVKYLREDMAFNNLDELKAQLLVDKRNTVDAILSDI